MHPESKSAPPGGQDWAGEGAVLNLEGLGGILHTP